MRKYSLATLLLVGVTLSALCSTSINSVNSYAYAANAGWVDAYANGANGAFIGRYVCSNYLYGANIGWVHLGSGLPANGISYSNVAANDYGVNVDAYGNLTGYAWGANIGWITFEQTYGKPSVDMSSGALEGYIWSGNIGWISLSNAQAFVQTDYLANGPDTDGDGLPDPWEYTYTNVLTGLTSSPADADGDGSPDEVEFGAGTDPTDPTDLLQITAFVATNATAPVITWTTKDTRFYEVKQTDNLTNTTWSSSSIGLVTAPSTPTETETASLPSTNSIFMKVEAILPLSP